MAAYADAKFLGASWCRKMASESGDAFTTVWISPGATSGTDVLRDQPYLMRMAMAHIMPTILPLFGLQHSLTDGALRYVAAMEGEVGNSGDILGSSAKKLAGPVEDQTVLNPRMVAQPVQNEVWRILTDLAGPL